MPAETTPENRSMPAATVIPVLAYDDVRQATDWLCAAFGFEERLRIGEHRVQLVVGDGAVIVNKRRVQPDDSVLAVSSHEIMVRVDDVDRALRARSGAWRAYPSSADQLPVWRATVQRRRFWRPRLDVLADHRRRRPRRVGWNACCERWRNAIIAALLLTTTPEISRCALILYILYSRRASGMGYNSPE